MQAVAGTLLTEAELLVAGVVVVDPLRGFNCRFLACEIFSLLVDWWIFWGGMGCLQYFLKISSR